MSALYGSSISLTNYSLSLPGRASYWVVTMETRAPPWTQKVSQSTGRWSVSQDPSLSLAPVSVCICMCICVGDHILWLHFENVNLRSLRRVKVFELQHRDVERHRASLLSAECWGDKWQQAIYKHYLFCVCKHIFWVHTLLADFEIFNGYIVNCHRVASTKERFFFVSACLYWESTSACVFFFFFLINWKWFLCKKKKSRGEKGGY